MAIFYGGVSIGLTFTPLAPWSPFFGLISLGFWEVSRQFTQLSSDPPRDDYDVISIWSPATFNLRQSNDKFEQLYQPLLVQLLEYSEALHDLLLSYERSQGAEKNLKNAINSSERNRVAQALRSQVKAIADNQLACERLCASLMAASQNFYIFYKEISESDKFTVPNPMPAPTIPTSAEIQAISDDFLLDRFGIAMTNLVLPRDSRKIRIPKDDPPEMSWQRAMKRARKTHVDWK